MTINDREFLFYDCIMLKESYGHLDGMREWSVINSFIGRNTCPIDRTGTLTMPIKTKALPWLSIPKPRSVTDDFQQICHGYADKIWKQARNKNQQIAVLWSGGIDSTLALTSLMATASQQDLQSMTILLSKESIAEYPWFYHNLIQHRVRVDSSELWYNYLNPATIVVSGEGGDQAYGSSVVSLMKNIPELATARSIDVLLSTCIKDYDQLKESCIHPLMETFPGTVDHPLTPIWWTTFCLDWQYRYIDILINTPLHRCDQLVEDTIRHNWIMFFQDDAIQSWAMEHHPRFFQSFDKKIFKSVILEYTGDNEYYQTKKKQSSMMNLRFCRPARFGIDSAWRVIQHS